MKTKVILFSLIATTIISCNTGKQKNDVENNTKTEAVSKMNTSIENTRWVITKLNGGDMSDREENGQEIFFMLDAKTNRVSGNSGCNTFMGTYKMEDGNKISFSQLASTRMMCPDAKINESEIINIFETVDNYTITDGVLSLNKAKKAPLAQFKKVEMATNHIVEKYWKLKTLEGKEIKMADKQEREIYFTLKTNENRVVGFAGCNAINGEYIIEEGNRIRFKNVATTLKACPDVDVNEAEVLNVFNIADNYTINNDVLSLNVGRRAPLAVFEAVYMQ